VRIPNPLPARRRIATMVSNAAFNARSKHQDTTWSRSITIDNSALILSIVFPAKPKLFPRLGGWGNPMWTIDYVLDGQQCWQLRQRPNARLGASELKGTMPHDLPAQMWTDIRALLP
jgi:hypothetical protein